MKPIAQAFLDLQDEFCNAGVTLSDEAIATLVTSERLKESLVKELGYLYEAVSGTN